MRVQKASQILSVKSEELLDPAAIKRAAAEAIRHAHPDMGGDPDLAPAQIKLAKEARDTLLRHAQTDAPDAQETCPLCNGKGKSKSRGFVALECPRCLGTGFINV